MEKGAASSRAMWMVLSLQHPLPRLRTDVSGKRPARNCSAVAGVGPRAILRKRGTPYAELGLDDTGLSDDALLDHIMEHPVLIERPIVVSPKGARLCRPPESVQELL